MNADGSGEHLVPTTTDPFKSVSDWSREGLIVESISPTTIRDLWSSAQAGRASRRPGS
jgi:hypothetical protein